MRKIDLTKNDVIKEYLKEKSKGYYDLIKEQYTDPATKYCFRVLDEEIITAKTIKLMAFRHLQDLRRITECDNFPYYYDLKECRKILNFSSCMIDISTGTPLELMDWQASLLCMINAWKNKEDDSRRFNRVIFSVARTNGKTAISAIQLLYTYIIELADKTGQECVLVAPNNTQATKGFSYLALQMNRLREIPAFRKELDRRGIIAQTDQIISKQSQNKVLKMSFEGKRFDSLHPAIIIADEVADDTKRGLIDEGLDKLASGQVQIKSPLFIQISTAYPDSSVGFKKQWDIIINEMKKDYSRKLENTLGVIYTQDDVDKETNEPNTWIKSNPILELPGVGEQLHNNLLKQKEEKETDNTLYSFQNKNLNCWLNRSKDNFLELEDIEKAKINQAPIDIKGKECYIGIDLSNFSDDTSISFVFPYLEDNRDNYYIYSHSFVPLARSQNSISLKEKKDQINYRHMEDLGLASITTNELGYINNDEVYTHLMEFITDNNLDVQAIIYDSWRSDTIIKLLEQNTDYPLIPLQQTVKFLNDPTKEFQQKVREGKVHYLSEDEIIETGLKNAIITQKDGFIKIDKNSATKKIDVVDSIIDAFYRARLHFENIDFNTDNKKTFGRMSADDVNTYFEKEFSF